VVVDEFGYPAFFSYAAILGIPAIVLAWYVWQQSAKRAVVAKADPAVERDDPLAR
jgi:PAT family beta-lactamase induction signal transducer AmpG